MEQGYRLLQHLQGGALRSGEELGALLGISRAAVWKQVRHLLQKGLPVQSVRGRGYRLARPIELLDPERIAQAMGPAASRRLGPVEVVATTDSTNDCLRRRLAQGRVAGPQVLIAECQAAGRGRRGRGWVSPFAGGIWMSVLWPLPHGIATCGGLSLALGVAAVRALRGAGLAQLGLKWPNDLLWQGRKLGGILVEFSGEAEGPAHAIIGIGINTSLPVAAGEAIDQPWVDLERAGGIHPGRNELAGRLLRELVEVLSVFERSGFAALRDEWVEYDALAGQPVRVESPAGPVTGHARGVDRDGALLVEETSGQRRRFLSGLVSVRLHP